MVAAEVYQHITDVLVPIIAVSVLLGIGWVAFRKGNQDASKDTLDALKAASEAWQSRCGALESELSEVKNNARRLEAEVRELKGTRAELLAQVTALQDRPDYSEIVTAHRDLINLVSESVANERRLREHAHAGRAELAAANKKLDELLLRLPVGQAA